MFCDKSKLLKMGNRNERAEIDCLKRLVGIPSCYNKKHDVEPIITQLTEEFEKREYKVQIFPTPGAPILVAETKQRKKRTLLFYNHYDVQPEEPLEEWKSPPYTLEFAKGRLYGRGTSDNKGPLVANIFGVQNALEAGYEPKCNIRFIIEGEEEPGSVHLKEFCKANPELLKSDGCIWEEANAVPNQRSVVYAGVKGDVYLELVAKGFHKDAHSGDAPIVVNPAWRLVWALSTLKNEKEKILIDGFYDDVVPPRKEELELFANYPLEQIEQYKKLYKTEEFLLGREGKEFWTELILRPTCTICGLSAGWKGPGKKTVIGKEAIAKVDFRLVPNQQVESVLKLLRKHLDSSGFPDIELRLLSGYGSNRTPVDSPFIHMLTRLVKEFSGRDSVLLPSWSGSGPAYLFGPYTPWATCRVFDPESNAHAPNESIRLSDLKYMTAFVATITVEVGRT